MEQETVISVDNSYLLKKLRMKKKRLIRASCEYLAIKEKLLANLE